MVDNASTDGTVATVERLGDPRVRRAAQRGEPGQGRLAAARHARGARRAAAALRRRLRPLGARARTDAGAERARRRGRRARGWRRARASAGASRSGAGSPAASFVLLCRAVLREPTRDLFCGFKLWRAPAAEAVVPRDRPRRLDVRRRGARHGARAGLPDRRDRDPLDRPRGLAAVDAAGDRAGHARAARGARPRPPRGAARSAAAVPCRRGRRAARRATGRAAAGTPGAHPGRAAAWRWRRSPARGSRWPCSAGLLLKAWMRGGVVTGADGYLVADPLQYLDWSRQAGEHGLIGNRHDLAPGGRAFLHPGLLLSGVAWRLGAGPAVAYLLWKPVAIVVLFAGARALVRRFLTARGDRRLALVLALFFVLAGGGAGGLGRAGRSGRPSSGRLRHRRAVVGHLPVGLPVHGDRRRAAAAGAAGLRAGAAGGGGRCLAAAAGAGLLCAWLQPWQGATFAIAARGGRAGAACARRPRRPRRAVDLAPPLAATALPLVYYALLGRFDASWALAGRSTTCRAGPGGCSCWAGAAGPAGRVRLPAAGARLRRDRPAGLAARRAAGLPPAVRHVPVPRVPGARAAARRCWPARAARPAGRAAGAARCRRWRRWWCSSWWGRPTASTELRRRRAARAPAVPPDRGRARRAAVPRRAADARRRAGARLHRHRRAGLHRARDVDRRRLVDARPAARAEEAEALFAGRLDAAEAEALVRRSGARFLLSDCHGRADIARILARLHRPAAAVRLRDRVEVVTRAAAQLPARRRAARDRGAGDRRLPRRVPVRRLRAPAAPGHGSRSSTSACRCSSPSPASCSTGPWVAARLDGGRAPAVRVYAAAARAPDRARVLGRAGRHRARCWGGTACSTWPDGLVYFGFLQAYDPTRSRAASGRRGRSRSRSRSTRCWRCWRSRRCGGAAADRAAVLRGEALLLAGLAALSLVWRLLVLAAFDAGDAAYFPLVSALPTQLDTFAGGMALAVAQRGGRGRRPPGRVRRPLGRGCRGWPRRPPTRRSRCGAEPSNAAYVLVAHELQTVVALGLLAPAVLGAGAGGAIRGLLAWRPLAWVGIVSYGLYLWHLDVLRELAGRGIPGVPAFADRGWRSRSRSPPPAGTGWSGTRSGWPAAPARAARAAAARRRSARERPRRARRRRAAAGGAVRAGARQRRLLRRGAAVGGARGLRARRGGRLRRAGAAAAHAAGRLALAGLAGLLAWTLLSRSWAPVAGAANADAQRLALYLAALVAAAALLRGPAARWVEPALAAGATAVVALRPERAPGAAARRPGRPPGRDRAARAAADLLERDGRAGCPRARARRPAGRRRRPVRCGCAWPPARPPRRSAPAWRSRSRAARSPRR